MAVGLTKPGHKDHDKDWYRTMYYKSSTDVLSFKRKKFYNDANPVTISDDDFEVEGAMGSTHITTAYVIVKPRKRDDYAPSLIKNMSDK